MSLFFNIVLVLALIGILIYIIAENQHPTQTLAWVLVIVFLPVVGLILYFLVGHRPVRKQLLPEAERLLLQQRVTESQAQYIAPAPDPYAKLDSLQRKLGQGTPLAGNATRGADWMSSTNSSPAAAKAASRFFSVCVPA